MNWLDILLLIIIAASVAGSFRKGLSREIIHLASVVLALLSACWFYGTVGSYLTSYLSSPQIANFIGFALVFAAVIALGHAVSYVVGRFLKITGLSIFDHLLGAVFGALRGALISVALIMAIMVFFSAGHRPDSVVNSRIAPYVVEVARAFAAMAPHELKEGFRKSYGEVKAAWEGAVKRGSRVVPCPPNKFFASICEPRTRFEQRGVSPRAARSAVRGEPSHCGASRSFHRAPNQAVTGLDPGWNHIQNERQI